MSSLIEAAARERTSLLRAIAARIVRRRKSKQPPLRRPFYPHEIEAVRLDYERRKAEISLMVRSRGA